MRWLKLYPEILDDRPVAQLPDHLWRRLVEMAVAAAGSGTWPDIRGEAGSILTILTPDEVIELAKASLITFRRDDNCWQFICPHFSTGDDLLQLYGWHRLRLQILEAFGYRCAYCGEPAEEVDHVIPKAKGGTDTTANLVAACRQCNRHKWARTPEDAGMEFR